MGKVNPVPAPSSVMTTAYPPTEAVRLANSTFKSPLAYVPPTVTVSPAFTSAS